MCVHIYMGHVRTKMQRMAVTVCYIQYAMCSKARFVFRRVLLACKSLTLTLLQSCGRDVTLTLLRSHGLLQGGLGPESWTTAGGPRPGSTNLFQKCTGFPRLWSMPAVKCSDLKASGATSGG